jgi:hypothetical protein
MPTFNQVTAALVPCALPNSDGQPCGKPGMVGLPSGICGLHAIEVHRSVKQMIDTEVAHALAEHDRQQQG